MIEKSDLIIPAPAPVLRAWTRLDGNPVVISTSTDLSLSGDPATEWLVGTKDWIAIADSSPKLLREVSLADAKSFRACAAVGSGFLQANIDGAWIDLLRYSKKLSPRFTKIAKKLESLKATGTLIVDPNETAIPTCPTCGARLRYAGELCLECLDRRAVVKRALELISPHRWSTLILFVLVLIGIAVSLIPPKLQEYLVDGVLAAGQRSPAEGFLGSLGAIVLGLALARLISAGVGQVKGIVSHRIGTRLTFLLRARLVDKLNQLPIAFYDKNQIGMLASRVTSDTEALYGFLHQLTHGFLLQILQFAGVGVMLFVINPKLAFFTLIPAPLVVAGSVIFWRYVHPKYFRLTDSSSKQMTALLGLLSGIRVVKAFAQEEREVDRFAGISRHLHDTRLDVGHSATTYGISMSLVFSLGGLIVWYVGGKDVIESKMTLGSLIAFLAYLAMFYAPLSTLAQLTTWLSSFVASSARVLELLDTPSEMIEAKDPKPLGPDRGSIRFDDVSFGYDRHQLVLEHVGFSISPGQMVGVVGKSGSGKTTLAHLICRLYDAGEGRIEIGGVDVRDLSLSDLRRNIGVVFQETFLFRGTVWENLTYGRADATPEQAMTASMAAQAHEFIMKMPFGYDTPIGERGVNLSGGERQRLAIARALLYDPAILILDEATSNLDTEAERAIQEALAVVAEGRTVLAIAHRLSTLRNASRILVFEKGKLIEDGAHEELVAKDGTYANLLRLQSRLTESTAIQALAEPKAQRFEPRWLTPASTKIFRGERGDLRAELDGTVHGGVSAALAFPTQPGRWICLATDKELGIVRDVSEWSRDSQIAIEEALGRRYHLNVIEAIDRIDLSVGVLTFRVRTKRGPGEFKMRWNQTSTQDYGKDGKLLTDLEENAWLVADVGALPKRQQWLFRRYVYW